MFRKNPDFFMANQVAAMQLCVDILQSQHLRKNVSSKLSVLMYAINQFEKHRLNDFFENKNERAEQVLHTAKIFQSLYKNRLKDSSLHDVAKQLHTTLKTYKQSVKEQIASVDADLYTDATPPTKRLASASINPRAILDSYLEAAETDTSYDYFGVTDMLADDAAAYWFGYDSDASTAEYQFNHSEDEWLTMPLLPERNGSALEGYEQDAEEEYSGVSADDTLTAEYLNSLSSSSENAVEEESRFRSISVSRSPFTLKLYPSPNSSSSDLVSDMDSSNSPAKKCRYI